MSLILFTHTDMLGHVAGRAYVEQPDRLCAVMGALDDAIRLDRRFAPEVATEDLLLVHPTSYVERIAAIASQAGFVSGFVKQDPDTGMSPGSLRAGRPAPSPSPCAWPRDRVTPRWRWWISTSTTATSSTPRSRR